MIRMGKSSKKQEPNDTTVIQEQPKTSSFSMDEPQRPPSNAFSESELMARDIKEGRLSGFVGNGTVLTGETSFETMLRVDGHLTGKVSSTEGTLIIGSTGRVDANINVQGAVINGTVNGDIIASQKLMLGRTARVVGNIQTPRLMMEDGAILEGNCSMLESKENFDKRIKEEKKKFETNEFDASKRDETEKDETPVLGTSTSSEEKEENADAATN